MVAADIYRSVVGMKWAYRRVVIAQVQADILRSEAGISRDASPRWKASKRRSGRLWSPGPSNPAICRGIGLWTRQSYTRERKPSAAPCADASRHEYECPERRPEVRKVGIRIPGHIRPPLASPSNSFGTSLTIETRHRVLNIRAMRFRSSLKPRSYARTFARNAETRALVLSWP